MIKVEPVGTALHIQLALKRPIFEWQGVPGRFFSMIYDALSEALPISSKEFSAVGANQLSEVRAVYAIYGGASSVALSTDALLFDFPQLALPGDVSVVQNILRRVHDAFPKSFPELSYGTLNLQSYQHLAFADEKLGPASYLAKFFIPKSTEVPKSIVVHPGTKFELVSEDLVWKCSVGVERSQANARAVFVSIRMTINGVEPYEQKAEVVKRISSMCDEILGLES